jgi:ethanolamine ammonia-lyase small subunit
MSGESTDLARRLRAVTQARVALGRAGQGLPTAPMLDFQLAHARARDAVHAELDTPALSAALGCPILEVASQASDRATYLQRPDLGRRLGTHDLATTDAEVAFVIADGLSATAVQAHAAPLVAALQARLADWRIAPIVVARHARVALGDAIGAALGVDMVVVLIGERPGLSAPDSLGAYLTWAPRPGRSDSERNCVSNIRPPHGLDHPVAADRIVWLMREARARRLSGVALKDASAPSAPALPET